MPQHIVVTGGAGFIGRAVVERLVARGDRVTALVRDPAKAAHLGPSVELVRSDLRDTASLTGALRGADAVIHGAGQYRIGVPPSERPAMWDANVGATERVLDAAIAAGVPRIVYLSTVNVFGNTKGRIADEAYRRNLDDGFVSYYDETKFRAHEAAEARIAAGAPIVVVLPGTTYGPHDHSTAGDLIAQAHGGKLRYTALTTLGGAWVHVDDLADGIVAAVDRGRLGELYILAGELRTLAQAIEMAARIGGRRPPRLHIPTALLRLTAPLNDRLGGLPSMPASLADTIAAADHVTYYASHAKAQRELGFTPRSLAEGIADTWGKSVAR
ncbi:MAG: NAD-dependent epimerase/dehydratase family protein [Chloroflexota bacterium]